MEIYKLLNLDALKCSVAIIKNVPSKKMGRKDIIKIDEALDVVHQVFAQLRLLEVENGELFLSYYCMDSKFFHDFMYTFSFVIRVI